MPKITASRVTEGMAISFKATHTEWVEEIVATITRKDRRIFLANPEGQRIGSALGWAPGAVFRTNDI